MSNQVYRHIREALATLKPEEIERHTQRPVRLILYAHGDDQYREMEDFLLPAELSQAKRAQVSAMIQRASEGYASASSHDLEVYYEDSPPDELTPTRGVFGFRPGAPERFIARVLEQRGDLASPLAMHVLPFREEVSRRIIKKVAKENALFALATAVPDILPFVSLPWTVGEFASDTAVLTANQIRMAFLLAAASEHDFGYREQKGEIASIVLGAFGWRAMARELAGKIPMGGGLIPKAAIAYAGTRVVGLSLERFYRLGVGFTRQERRSAYEEALERGRSVAAALLNGIRRKEPA